MVDDDPEIRRAVHDALQESGVVVIAQASDGREGVELVWHYKPDVVVLDVFMPGVDGVRAMQRIHERLPDTRCIMLSVSSDPDLGVLALRAGIESIIELEGEIYIRWPAPTLDSEMRRKATGKGGAKPARPHHGGRANVDVRQLMKEFGEALRITPNQMRLNARLLKEEWTARLKRLLEELVSS